MLSEEMMHKAVGWMLREVGKSTPTTPAYKGTKGIDLLREFLSPILHAFLIDHIATNSILTQDVSAPLAELGGADTGTWVLLIC